MNITQELLTEDDKFLLERIYTNHDIPIHVFSAAGLLIYQNIINEEGEDIFTLDKSIADNLRRECGQQEFPLITQEEEEIFYAAFERHDQVLFVFGPIAFQKIKGINLAQFKSKHHLTDTDYEITCSSITKLAGCLAICAFYYEKKKFSEKELILLNNRQSDVKKVSEEDVSLYQMTLLDEERQRLNYAYEERLLEGIRKGILETFPLPRNSVISKETPLRKIIRKAFMSAIAISIPSEDLSAMSLGMDSAILISE